MKNIKSNEPFLVIIGPSGSGKSTIANALAKDSIFLTLSHTTRKPRNDDLGDHEYTASHEFTLLKQKGHYLDTIELFGSLYGLPKIKTIPKRIPAIVLRANLINMLLEHYHSPVIYQIEASQDIALLRMKQRNQTKQDIEQRLLNFEKEVKLGRKLASRVVYNNGKVDDAVIQIKQFLKQDFTNKK